MPTQEHSCLLLEQCNRQQLAVLRPIVIKCAPVDAVDHCRHLRRRAELCGELGDGVELLAATVNAKPAEVVTVEQDVEVPIDELAAALRSRSGSRPACRASKKASPAASACENHRKLTISLVIYPAPRSPT